MEKDYKILIPLLNYISDNLKTNANAEKAQKISLDEFARQALTKEQLIGWEKIKSKYDKPIIAFTEDCCGEMKDKTFNNYKITHCGIGVDDKLAKLLGKNLIKKDMPEKIFTYSKHY